jgi:hypothetical protein
MKSNFKALLLLVLIAFGVTANAKSDLLVQAEHFANKGQWVLDQQFIEEMGSAYLLAHGMGVPVENASTEVTFPAKGKYHVWVRTKNWAPGNWAAPGVFKLTINGKELKTTFGTETGWTWQYGGTKEIDKLKTKLELVDLKGFEGRCDAIYFSTERKAPPSDVAQLRKFYNQKLNDTYPNIKDEEFDFVVIGGGIAGCGAAIAAAEQGLKVALVNDRPVLGGNASKEVRVHTLGIYGKTSRILKMIDTKHWPNGSHKSIADNDKRQKNIDKYKNIHQFLFTRAYSVDMKNDSEIKAVNIKHLPTGKRTKLTAPVFVDCTGDGWIGYWAGAEYSYGRESKEKYGESWDKHGELWSPKKADNRTMGSSVLWNSMKASSAQTFPEVPWAMDVAKKHVAVNGEWYWEFGNNELNQMYDAEQIRDHVFKAIYGSFSNAKKLDKYRNQKLKFVAYIAGRRESRRLVGDYVFTGVDAVNGTKHEDDVVEETREVDIHFQRILKDKKQPDFLSTALFKHVPRYYIPFRSLYSKNISNLMMAGRNFSCSHVGLGGPRVMNTTGQMGIATGYAASLCKKHDVNPRGVYKKYIKDLRQLIENSNKK